MNFKILSLIHQNLKQQIRHISTDFVLFLAVCSYVHRLKNASSSLNEDGNSSYYSFIFALHCVNVFMSTAPWKKLSANGYSGRICQAILIFFSVIVCNLSDYNFDSTCGSNFKIWNALRVFNVNISQLTQYVSNNKINDGLKSFKYLPFYETFF